jgi:hypothetical protein
MNRFECSSVSMFMSDGKAHLGRLNRPRMIIPLAFCFMLAASIAHAERYGTRVTRVSDVSERHYVSDDGTYPEPVMLDETHGESMTGDACPECEGEKKCHGVCKHPGYPAKPRRTLPGDRDWGDCPPERYCEHDCVRAGNPHAVAPWAKCSITDKYGAWYTGGGAAFVCGRPRTAEEGTWGLDYTGLFGHANVWLNYTRGRKQGGEGAYETVGGPEPFKFLKHE